MTQPDQIAPGTELARLRAMILATIAEFADARDDLAIGLKMIQGGLYLDAAAVLDRLQPTLDDAATEAVAVAAQARRLRLRIAQERGEAPPDLTNNVIPFRRKAAG